MFFLNLSALEFFSLLGVLGGAITALYFLDRSKRRKVVSTLQFWTSAAGAVEQTSKKKVNQPWSLLLQLLSLALLLLAIAQLQWGTRTPAGRDHVLLLDTSAWSAAQSGNGTVLQQEKTVARKYLDLLPVQDRVLLARADALASPATLFTNDRDQTRNALRETDSSLSALDLGAVLAYATQAQRASGGASGDIVYVGPQRLRSELANLTLPQNLRVLPTPVTGENSGIRTLEVTRDEADPASWHAGIAIVNYGKTQHAVKLRVQFAGTPFAARTYSLSPGQEVAAEYVFTTNTQGTLKAELDSPDALSADNQAAVFLPGAGAYSVAVYTRRPEMFKPLLNADRSINAAYFDLSGASTPAKADLVIVDGASTPQPPQCSTIWINPPAGGSPFVVRTSLSKAALNTRASDLMPSNGLQSREERLDTAKVFDLNSGDVPLATAHSGTEEGPAVVLRSATSGPVRMAAIGFDPLSTQMRFTVTTPLLFANLLEWMAPEGARANEVRAGRVGTASVALEGGEDRKEIRVTADDGRPVPFTLHEHTLQLFTNKPTTVRIVTGSRSRVLALTLPDVANQVWTPDKAHIATGLPSELLPGASSLDLWQWLACLGAVGLLAEWILYGRSRGLRRTTQARPAVSTSSPESRKENLVA